MQPTLSCRPATKYQWIAMLLWTLARHASVAPPLTVLSRALGRSDSFAHEVLRQLLRRRDPPHGRRASRGVDSCTAWRWLLLPDDPRYPGHVDRRLQELMTSFGSPMEAFEMIVCFHFVMESCDAPARVALAGEVIRRLTLEPSDVRARRLKGLLQHAMADHGMNLQEALLDPPVARMYEEADILFNVATGVEASDGPRDEVLSGLAALSGRSLEAFVLASFLLVARLGALPGLALSGRAYLHHLERSYAASLRHVPVQPCADYAARFDYGEDLACVLRARKEAEVDILPLLEQALSIAGHGALKRRRRAGPELTSWTKEEARRAVRKFQAWALTHHYCRLLVPILDLRNERSELARDVARLARWASQGPLDQAIGEMLVADLFVTE